MMGTELLRPLARWGNQQWCTEPPCKRAICECSCSCSCCMGSLIVRECAYHDLTWLMDYINAQDGKGQQQRIRGANGAVYGAKTAAESHKGRAQKQGPAATAGAAQEPEDAETSEDVGDGSEPGDVQSKAAQLGAAVQPLADGAATAAHPAPVDTTVFVRGLPLDILQYELQVGNSIMSDTQAGVVHSKLWSTWVPPTN